MAEEATLRDALSEAFDKAEEKESEDNTPTPQELMDGTPGDQGDEEEQSGKGSDETTGEEETTVTADSEGDEKKPLDDGSSSEQESTAGEEESSGGATFKAPASWSPKAKEDWGKVPRHLQEEITNRERAYSVGIQEKAEAAKFGDTMKQVLAPHQHTMAAEGVDEATAIHNLAGFATTMRFGTNKEKAQTMANLIGMYEVDIGTLDSMLAGEEVEDGGMSQIESLLNRRLQPLENMLQQGQQNAFNSIQQNNASEIDTFAADAANEFFEDVRLEMADIIDVRAAQGKECSLKEAYDIAVSMRPDIQEILTNRTKQEQLQNNQQKLQGKKAAASSVASSSSSSSVNEEPKTLRGSVLDAWEKVEGDSGGRI